MPWRCLAKYLHSLTLEDLKSVVNLPKGMCLLTALQSLRIGELPFKDLPDWIGCLSSLQSLQIRGCKYLESLLEAMWKLTSLRQLELCDCKESLKKRRGRPDGEDWPNIQHILYGKVRNKLI